MYRVYKKYIHSVVLFSYVFNDILYPKCKASINYSVRNQLLANKSPRRRRGLLFANKLVF
jgi:hypothetical protein